MDGYINIDDSTLEPATDATTGNATPWRVSVSKPRGRETSLYLRARRTVDGRREEERQSAFTTDRAEAVQLAAVWQAKLNGTAVQNDDPTVLEVVHARVRALQQDKDVETATRVKYERVERMLAGLPLAAVRASDLSRRHLVEARDAIKAGGKKGRSNSTTNSTLHFLAACWNWAHKEREQVSKPWPKLEPLDEAKQARPKRAYTAEEVLKILDYVRDHEPEWHPPFALLAATGARLNDVLSLRCGDVLRDAGIVMLRDPKTHEPVEVGVPADVLALLPDRAPTAYLFPSPRTGAHLTDSGALRCLRRTLRALGVADAEWLDLHSFRRAWCADAEDAGVSRHQAMKQTGHQTGEMFDLYASKARGRKRQSAERVHAYRQRVAGKEPAAPATPAATPTGDVEPAPALVGSDVTGCPRKPAVSGQPFSPMLLNTLPRASVPSGVTVGNTGAGSPMAAGSEAGSPFPADRSRCAWTLSAVSRTRPRALLA